MSDTTSLQAERDAFEKWMSDEGETPQAVERLAHGYARPAVAYAWWVWQAALSSRQAVIAVPEGWKLVPIEPTEAMWDAGRDPVMYRDMNHYRPPEIPTPRWQLNPDGTLEKDTSKGTTAVHVWRAMLDAAPTYTKAPTPGQGKETTP